jgi:hypothetical protein
MTRPAASKLPSVQQATLVLGSPGSSLCCTGPSKVSPLQERMTHQDVPGAARSPFILRVHPAVLPSLMCTPQFTFLSVCPISGSPLVPPSGKPHMWYSEWQCHPPTPYLNISVLSHCLEGKDPNLSPVLVQPLTFPTISLWLMCSGHSHFLSVSCIQCASSFSRGCAHSAPSF